MKKVYIAQLKCSGNHCVLAVVGEFESPEAAKVLIESLSHVFYTAVEMKVLKQECSICHETDLRVQLNATRFRTVAEAEPFLRESAEAQRQTAEYLRAGRN